VLIADVVAGMVLVVLSTASPLAVDLVVMLIVTVGARVGPVCSGRVRAA
jgi:hypothetical protein